ncbi:MAG: hypothetical protein HKN09_04880 [Saprospiraceae bacterium]|nr:hypothetical protein [Saprospiraceae bacterium]
MSFKAKVIESPEYYKLKRKLLWFNVFPISIFIIPSVIVEESSLLVIGLIVIIGYMFLVQKKLSEKYIGLFDQRKLVVDKDTIGIYNKKKELLESYPLSELNSLEINTNFNMDQESHKEIIQELAGITRRNSIVLKPVGKSFDFAFDSYYMIEQLKKLVQHWQASDINIKLKPTVLE